MNDDDLRQSVMALAGSLDGLLRRVMALCREEAKAAAREAVISMTDAPHGRENMSIAEAAEYFGVSQTWIFKQLADPTSGCAETTIRLRGTRRRLVVVSAFRAWLKQCAPQRRRRRRRESLETPTEETDHEGEEGAHEE